MTKLPSVVAPSQDCLNPFAPGRLAYNLGEPSGRAGETRQGCVHEGQLSPELLCGPTNL